MRESEFRNARDFRRRSMWYSSWICSTASIEFINGASSFSRRYVSRSPEAISRRTLITARGTGSIAGRAHTSHRNPPASAERSEEHTSELQSPYDLVCRLLLEKKKKKHISSSII